MSITCCVLTSSALSLQSTLRIVAEPVHGCARKELSWDVSPGQPCPRMKMPGHSVPRPVAHTVAVPARGRIRGSLPVSALPSERGWARPGRTRAAETTSLALTMKSISQAGLTEPQAPQHFYKDNCKALRSNTLLRRHCVRPTATIQNV